MNLYRHFRFGIQVDHGKYFTTIDELAVAVVVYLHDITTYINIREISQMNHANKDLKEVKNL